MIGKYRIISLDPGTSFTGVSVIEVDLETKDIEVLFVETFELIKLIRRKQYLVEMHSERFAKIQTSCALLHHLIELYEVDAVVSESPYLGRFAASFAALTEILFGFRTTTFNYDPGMPFYTIEPSVVKKHMGVKGTSKDKNLMTIALKDHTVSIPDCYNIDTLDEHSIDCICVGLTHIATAV